MQRAAELEMPAMALLDRNGVYGAPRFHMEGQRRGVRAHIGAEVARKRPGRTVAACTDTCRISIPSSRCAAAAGRVTHRVSESLPPHHSLQAAGEHEGRRRGADH